jgi:hypothetical protein
MIMNKQVRVILLIAFSVAFALKLLNIKSGGPQIMIDDYTLYDGGFLVWFGNAPPQHAYFECWLNGISSLLTFAIKCLYYKQYQLLLTIELVPNAYRDFYNHPDIYYSVYRFLLCLVDLTTAFIVYLSAKLVLRDLWKDFAAALVAILYLFTFNTYWCLLMGRPDTLVSLFASLGIYYYLKSEYDHRSPYFLFAAAYLGVAAGLKLHGAFFAIFVVLDLLRVRGLKAAIRPTFTLIPIALFLFVVSDGALLFDPLKYVKARLLTFKDDYSPYLYWGQQFLVMLRGSSWIIIPVLLCSIRVLLPKHQHSFDQKLRSIVFISFCWLLLFVLIRQLRAYWMLPALPLFYISSIYVLTTIHHATFKKLLTSSFLLIFFILSISQVQSIYTTEHNQLRNWIFSNVSPNQRFYILGFAVSSLPRNTTCIQYIRTKLTSGLETDINLGLGFTYRHVKNWEENSTLKLFDLLNNVSTTGYIYYDYYNHPLDYYHDIVSLHDMDFIVLQENFPWRNDPNIKDIILNHFSMLAECTAEGGEGYGMKHWIYRKNPSRGNLDAS